MQNMKIAAISASKLKKKRFLDFDLNTTLNSIPEKRLRLDLKPIKLQFHVLAGCF